MRRGRASHGIPWAMAARCCLAPAEQRAERRLQHQRGGRGKGEGDFAMHRDGIPAIDPDTLSGRMAYSSRLSRLHCSSAWASGSTSPGRLRA
jgi:hypothetical protein